MLQNIRKNWKTSLGGAALISVGVLGACGIVIPGGSRHWELLAFPENYFETHSVCSKESAAEMARRCRQKFGTDYALAVTETSPVDRQADGPPTAYVALSSAAGETSVPHQLLGDQSFLKSRAAKTALNLLRLKLLKAGPNE